MNLDRLRIFRDVVERGSIAAVARAHDLDPSAVSRMIASLERELGLRLLQRTTRRLTLTEAGTIYLERVSGHLDGLAEAHAAALEVAGEVNGLLRITASNGFGQSVLVPRIAGFLTLHPHVQLDLLLTDVVVDLVAERIDVAFRLGPKPGGDLVSGLLSLAPRRLVASPEWLRREGAPLHPEDLSTATCLITSTDRRTATWLFHRGAEAVEIKVTGKVATSNTPSLRSLALAHMGVSLLPDWLVEDDLASGRLIQLLGDWQASVSSVAGGVWIAYPSRNHLPAKARRFIDYMRSNPRGRE